MQYIKKTVLFILAVICTSCQEFQPITGKYIVNISFDTEEGDPPQPFFTANFIDPCVPKIGPVKNVRWNKRFLIVEQNIKKEERFHFVIARRKELSTFYLDSLGQTDIGSDTLVGPLNKMQLDSIVERYDVNVKKMKKNNYW